MFLSVQCLARGYIASKRGECFAVNCIVQGGEQVQDPKGNDCLRGGEDMGGETHSCFGVEYVRVWQTITLF